MVLQRLQRLIVLSPRPNYESLEKRVRRGVLDGRRPTKKKELYLLAYPDGLTT